VSSTGLTHNLRQTVNTLAGSSLRESKLVAVRRLEQGKPSPEVPRYRYAIFDHDSKFDTEVIRFLKSTGLKPKRTNVQAPWQNGTAERWVGSCRREMPDQVIALNEQHLRRLLRDYVMYYQQDRIHDSLEKDTPNRRPVEPRPAATATVVSSARLGGSPPSIHLARSGVNSL
jgi:hypothetical protein